MKPARNALKGYVYQQYIFTLFLAKMDVENEIICMENEAVDAKNFDDLYIKKNDISYRVQIKNYKDAKIEDISITDHIFTICQNNNEYDPLENNIVVINTKLIETNTKFMGLNAVVINGITILPLDEKAVEEALDNMFRTESRELQIIRFAYNLTSNAKFVVTPDILPDLIRITTDLENKTILIREPLTVVSQGITHIIGKPGVGKSHYVNELIDKYNEAIVYRFWISSQDRYLRDRLAFDRFLDDIGVAVFKSSKKFEIDDLIAEINNNCLMIILDGLDHVENYNKIDLQKFIDFVNMIENGKIVVLSRPLQVETTWQQIELTNWNFEETSLYLSEEYEIFEYEIQHNIFKMSDGYPIITYFLAEHYILNGVLNVDCQLKTIEEYYELLLENVNIKSALILFATNNSFFLRKEIYDLLDNSIASSMVYEFVENYPYLFKQVINRISLIHDSFNTYLRKQLMDYGKVRASVSKRVKQSLMSGNAEYMHRMMSFDFDSDFYDELIVKYCSFSEFKRLLNSTIDYNSITSFYNQIQLLLENRENILSIYQYYAFVLIQQSVNRIDMQTYSAVLYELFIYLKRRCTIEDCIFSSGAMWNLYVLLRDENETEYKRYLSGEMYSTENLYAVYRDIDEEAHFYDKYSSKIKFENIEKDLKDKQIYSLDKRNLMTHFLVSSWIFNENNEWYQVLKQYIDGDEEIASCELSLLLAPYNIEHIWVSGILPKTKYILQELGYLENENMFNNISLLDFIRKFAYEGSFNLLEYVKSFLRKVNHEEVDTDITSINFAWNMYRMRKDYSVITIPKALINFEKHGLIKADESIEIIRKLMKQSEKGIRHLLNEYINNKPLAFVSNLIKNGFFIVNDQVNVFELTSDRIDLFDEWEMIYYIRKRLSRFVRAKNVPYRDIVNIMDSKYDEALLCFLEYNDMLVYDVDKYATSIEKFNLHNVRYEISEEHKNDYVPLEYGCIHASDKQYIIDSGMTYIDMSKFVDGWYSCMPYVDFYQLYNKEDIKRNCLKILHTSIFAKKMDSNYIGVWYLLIGNILEFVDEYGDGVNWDILFEIFKTFLDTSLIYGGREIH